MRSETKRNRSSTKSSYPIEGRRHPAADLLRVDRIIAEIVPLLVRADLHRAEIVRPAAPIHSGIFAQVVVGVSNIPGSAPLRPRYDTTEQRERTRIEDSSLADALARATAIGQQLEYADRAASGGIHRVAIIIGIVIQPVADVVQRLGLRR